jgi:hypothetical protein
MWNMKTIGLLIFSIIGLGSRTEPVRNVRDIGHEIDAVMASAELKPSNISVRNYNYTLMSERSTYRVAHAKRYVSQTSAYVDCIVYEYDSKQASIQTWQVIAQSKHLDTMFKDYNFLFPSDNLLVLVRTGCNQTPGLWEAVSREFENRKLISDERFIRCICGGYCVVQ